MDRENTDKQIAPMISIIMPVFNTGAYLIEAINSVLNQQPVSGCELPSFELLIVDDQSIDQETIEILDGASLLDTRIQVFKNQRKKGAAGARNTGIMNARGKWIGFLDSDDIWFPRFTRNALQMRICTYFLQAASRSPAANTFLDNAFAVHGYFGPSPFITPYTSSPGCDLNR